MKKKLFRASVVALASLVVGACTTTTVDNSKANMARQQLVTEGIPFTPQALAYFARKGDTDKVQKFLDAGMDINALGGGATALMMATAYHPDMVKYLINHGADVNICTYHGTALTIAARTGNTDVARILLQNGADPNVIVLDGATPLMIAALNGKAEVIKVLVEFGAKIEYIHPVTSYTPLIAATYWGKKDAALALINLGANVNYIDARGISVLDWSQIGSYNDVTKALVVNGAKVEMKNNSVPLVILVALAHEDIPMIDFLVEKGISVNACYEKMPILVWCAKCNIPKSALELIKLGADISAKDVDGHTALDWAILTGQKKLAQAIDPKIDVAKINIPKDPNTLDQATLIGELINDQYYQGPVTSVQGLESILKDSITTDTSKMKDLRSDKVFKNPEIPTDKTLVHPGWENVSEFENFDKQIQSDMQSIDKSLNTQPAVTVPEASADRAASQPISAGEPNSNAVSPAVSTEQK